MARIAGVNLPSAKRIDIALTYIHGIGTTTAKRIIAQTGVDAAVRVKDLSATDANKLRDVVEKEHRVEGELRRETALNIKRLIEVNSYRGKRHRAGLPVRGQRTKTNARTRKGPRKAVAGKKK